MVIENPETVAFIAGERIVQRFTDVLRNMAYDAGWPEDIVSSLSLVCDGKAVQISYPESFSSRINNLEFGDVGQPPNSVLRTFMLRHENEASKELVELVAKDIYEHGGVL